MTVLSIHPGLACSSRLTVASREGQHLHVAELSALVAAGVGAAVATALLDFGLRIPGHAIIRVVLPMSFGLAVAPRRMAGMVMGASALLSALLMQVGGYAAIGVGAMTSLSLTGPLLDVALWRARPGWRLYAGFALAGTFSNLVALAVRAGTKIFGLDHAVGRPLAIWLPQAMVSYVICGALAGLICAAICFQFTADRSHRTTGA